MISRLSLNGGETWPTASILLSSELATPVSALVFARWIIIIEKDNDDDDDDHCCYVSSIVREGLNEKNVFFRALPELPNPPP